MVINHFLTKKTFLAIKATATFNDNQDTALDSNQSNNPRFVSAGPETSTTITISQHKQYPIYQYTNVLQRIAILQYIVNIFLAWHVNFDNKILC